MEVPSNTNPEKSFSFQLNPALKLKQSIRSLSDSDFNPQGLGVIEVNEKLFEITVRNTESGVTGYLSFKSSGLIDFNYSKPFGSKMVNLTSISHLLLDAADNSTITIFHVVGSNHLSFSLGNAPAIREFTVELLPMNAEFEKFPSITYHCEAIIPSDKMRQMLDQIEAFGKPQLVSVDISTRLVTFFIGQKEWLHEYTETNGVRGMAPGHTHHAWFHWPHLQSLRKASFLEPCFLLSFVTDPLDNIMTRFNFRELGDLVFINRAKMMIPNTERIFADYVNSSMCFDVQNLGTSIAKKVK